ncbi:UvrD-helicase domain-containing protein [Pelomonas sp. SE-A7]|uniref:UvrD-helicase domain-containing protein n=1 Tax=Pelomonas sp. SE-A7 TaxID=3054953 RepID=UPI00259C9F52|nr:UvrD-helicase domain-containing protein [Pelomonas sp. SE-A7]MDM4765972.1 UvrD-helicase domain-containing protein [Pelomonas sp. SE-A7]
MTPFHLAREAARQFRHGLFGEAAETGIASKAIIDAAASEDAEDFQISDANPSDKALGGADAVLEVKFRQIVVRNDVSTGERAFLVAHEFGHWKLHNDGQEGCHKVVDSTLKPEDADTFGAQKVEAYGARERSELQANIFARELLLPRKVARTLFLAGKTAEQLASELGLPLELVRQQLLDGLLLPEPMEEQAEPPKVITPTVEQIAAAQSKAKTSLVKAGPGTGKTATLLMRVQHLLETGAKPEELLLLTFSNRAARELVDRLQQLGIENAHEMWVGTFHAFGLEFLRKNCEQFGLKSRFGVADKMAEIAVLEPHIYSLGLQAFNPLGDPLDWLKTAVEAIQRAKDELADAAAYAAAVEESAADTPADLLAKRRDVAKLYSCYEEKAEANSSLVDMGDLVMLPALALTNNYDSFKASVGRFKHILVDEYQDVNRASAQLVKALAARAETLWVVGDARQAIYRFRGASMRSIVNFGDDYLDYQSFPLNENRRSYEEVVRVFEHSGRATHPLQLILPLDDVEPARGASGAKPRHVKCATTDIVRGEVAANVARIHGLDVAYRDQVVLASTHEICGDTADALNAAGIPALHLGDIFQRSEAKDLLALLQVFIDRSGSGLLRISRLPGLEMPAEDLDIILTWLDSARPEPLSWLDSQLPGLSAIGTAALLRWKAVFQGLASKDSPWEVICTLLLDRTNILAPHMRGTGILDITRRIALWQLIYFLRVPDGGHAYQNVGSFISRLRRRLRIGDDRELRVPPPEADSLDAVAVMTIHGSKGLEFEAVHLVDIDAKHFRMGADPDLVPESLLQSLQHHENFEEETEASNKLYVALSRAREHLVLYESQGAYKAQCVSAIEHAAHLLQPVQGFATAPKAVIPMAKATGGHQAGRCEFPGFMTYMVCPRRYYYDYVKNLRPASGLHPAALIEGAVMRELFVPYGADPSVAADDVERTLASLGHAFKDSLPHLRAYADGLLSAGRRLIRAQRAVMAKPFQVTCAGLLINVTAHNISSSGDAYTIDFVRTKPSGKLGRQRSSIRWMLKYLAAANTNLSFSARIHVLSTGEAETMWPDSPRFDNKFAMAAAEGLLAGNFEAKPNPWECPKCRHFLHCPA